MSQKPGLERPGKVIAQLDLDARLFKYPAQDLPRQEPDTTSLELAPEKAPSLNEVDLGLHLDLMGCKRPQSSSKKQEVCDIEVRPRIFLPPGRPSFLSLLLPLSSQARPWRTLLLGHLMIKGLMITPPVIGRIAIGKVVEHNGKRLPEKDDEFTITTQVQARGQWLLHPLDEALRQAASQPTSGIKEGAKPSSPEGSEEGDGSLQPAISTQPSQRSGERSLKEKMGVAADTQQAADIKAQPATAN